jgi:hypothetical protein
MWKLHVKETQDLNVFQGCTALAALPENSCLTYTSHDSCDDFVAVLAETIEEAFLEAARQSEVFSLMFDESTDCGVCQNLIVFIRFVHEGAIRTHFLALVPCSAGCKAEDIVKLLKGVVKQKNLDLSCMMAVSCDGASVMQGKDNGVVKQLRDEVPLLLHTHCAAHKLALASSQAANDITYLVRYQELVNCIHNYFKRSPKRTRNCQEIQKTLNEKILKYQQVFGTRWLSFFNSVNAISETY